MKTMGEVISNQRKEKGMTQAELAGKMNVTDKAVSKWERNLSCPDIHSLAKLAEVLEIPINELLNVKDADGNRTSVNEIVGLILKAVPLAMGIAVVVLSALKQLDAASAFVMLGVGLACLSMVALNNGAK